MSICTRRKLDICRYLIHGFRNEEIASTLNISIHTVKSYVSTMIYDHHVKNRTQLAYLLGKENFTGE